MRSIAFLLLLLPAVALAEPPQNRPSTSGSGSLSVSASVNINTLTPNANTGALPSNISTLIVTNAGTTNAALCIGGGTCTCAENAVAATNGVTIIGNGGGFSFNLVSVPWSRPTIVSCSGAAIPVTFVWGY